MIPDPDEADYALDPEKAYTRPISEFAGPWIRRAVAAEKDNTRLRAALECEYNRLRSLNRTQTHYEGCDGSQGHAICYAMRLIREALNPQPEVK